MKKDLGLSLDCIINGDSEEAMEIYRELGWYKEESKKQETYEPSPSRLIYFFLALILAWLSYLFIPKECWSFIERIIVWYGFVEKVRR